MEGKKKILIVSMAGGFGHIKIGQALFNYAKAHMADALAVHIDISDANPRFKKAMLWCYDIISRKLPPAWGIIYEFSDIAWVAGAMKALAGLNRFFGKKFKAFVKEYRPDAIIFTNVVSLSLLGSDFPEMLKGIKTGLVVTDYYGHAYYHVPWVDYFFAANESVAKDLERKGVGKEKIKVVGIPVDPKFYLEKDPSRLKSYYGIANAFPVVLFIASFRIAKKALLESLESLLNSSQNLHILFIASGNEKMHAMIARRFEWQTRLSAVKWTDAMDEYMRMADVVVSKSGGSTVSECLCLHKPMIIINPIPGQEEHNAEFVQSNGLGVRLGNINELARVLPEIAMASRQKNSLALPEENPCKKIFECF